MASFWDSVGNEWNSLKDEVKKSGVAGAIKKSGSDLASGIMTPGGILGEKAYAAENENSDSGGGGGSNYQISSGDWQGPIASNKNSSKSSSSKSSSSKSSSTKTSTSKKYEDEAKKKAKEAAEREKKARKNILSGMDSIYGRLDELSGMFPGWEQEDTQEIDSSYNTMKQGVDEARDTANKKIQGYKDDLETEKATNVRDLAGNMRKMLQAGNITLGASGAGDSSASNMYSFALGKEANKGRADIMRQTGDRLSKIQSKELDVKSVYDNQLQEIEKWKADKTETIKNKYQQLLMGVNEARRSADATKLQALNTLEIGLLNQAKSELAQLESEGRSYQQAVDQWVNDKVGQLDNIRGTITDTADNYDPEAITAPTMDGELDTQAIASGSEFDTTDILNALRKKRNESSYNTMA